MAAGLFAAAILALAALIIGSLLGRLARSSAHSDDAEAVLVERVNALLPQTQCAQCEYPGCRPYAEAIVLKDEKINRCPPGGDATIHALAELLGRPVERLDAELPPNKPPQVALIDEQRCVGCALCLPACPVDAIVGAPRYMHTVIAEQCTGCELCLPPCPVDCIDLVPTERGLTHWVWPRPA